MDQEISKKLGELDVRLASIEASIGKMRRYFFWVLVITLAITIVPLIGLIFVIPSFLSMYSSISGF